MVRAIVQEIQLQKTYLGAEIVETIYFGGGTPSLLSESEIDSILDAIYDNFQIAVNPEITLEANPDDLTNTYLETLSDSKINRLSIGIQSFSEADLQYMNRAHNASEAASCIENAKAAGFENLTIDLIYGTPTMSDQQWKENIEKILALDIPHISCYCLTVEEKTALHHFVKTGKSKPVDESKAVQQFIYLMETLEQAGYDHYEISNFGKPDHYSIHNSNYWHGKKYLGLGPAAHSFDGKSRQWNVANNAKYIQSIQDGKLSFENEELTPTEQYNEYILTSLRTIWGTKLTHIEKWGDDFISHFQQEVKALITEGKVVEENGKYTLSRDGKLFADRIAAELFF